MKINGDVIEFEYLSPVSASDESQVTAKQASFDDLDQMEKIGRKPLPAWQKRCQSVLVVGLTGFDRTRNESRIECGNDAVLFVGFDCFCELNGSDDL